MKFRLVAKVLFVLILISCQKEKIEVPMEEPVVENPKSSPDLIPIFILGDTLVSNRDTPSYEKTDVVLDSASNFSLELVSRHHYEEYFQETFFIRVVFDFEPKLRFLNGLLSHGFSFTGPIISTFEKGDTISINSADKEILDWYPEKPHHMNNTGWLKYHILNDYTIKENIKIGENYLVFKIGETGDERLGWLNVVYLDSVCYIKEGYYTKDIEESIVIGHK